MTQEPIDTDPIWPDPDEWIRLREASLAARYERVLAEALRYRDARDEHWERLVELQDRVRTLNAELHRVRQARARESRRARRELAQSRRKLARARKRLRELERSRAVRLARAVRSMRSRVGKLFGPRNPSPAVAGRRPGADRRPDDEPAVELPSPEPLPVTTYAAARGHDPAELIRAHERAVEAGRRFRRGLAEGPRQLRVAAVVDPFTAQSLSLECDLRHLHPATWQSEIAAHEPDLLFVESAWRGDGGSWHNTVPSVPDELRAILAYCREHAIPTAFWNKEDPVHFQTFLRVAGEFDHIFTTDVDCLPRYRDALGHERVHFLPFACQPRLQNPIETRPRVDALAFAGGYYTRYPERMRDLSELLAGVADAMPVHIWDREYGTTLDAYRFPDEFGKYVVGTLAPRDIEVAYKGYRFALNLNSVKNSQSMFARRAYELLSSGTVTVSNYARGLRVMLGDLVPASDDRHQTTRTLERLRASSTDYDRLRLEGLRKVHSEHTWEERLRYLTSCVTGDSYALNRRRITVVSGVGSAVEAERVVAAVRLQRGVDVAGVLVTDDQEARAIGERSGFQVLSGAEASEVRAGDVLHDSDGVAVLHPDDWLGPTYLLDLVLAWTYTTADVVGRHAFAQAAGGTVTLSNSLRAYAPCTDLDPRRSVVSSQAVHEIPIRALVADDPTVLASLSQFSIDRFDYCRDGWHADSEVLAAWVGSASIDTGVDTPALFARLAAAVPALRSRRDTPVLDRAVLAAIPTDHEVRVADITYGVRFQVNEARELPYYRWLEPRLPVADVASTALRLHLDYDGDLNLMMGGRFFDADGETLTSFTGPAHRNLEIPVPDGAESVALAIRTQGVGTSVVRTLYLDDVPLDPPVVPTGHDVLIVTDHYPSYDDLYRNGFLHTRVKAYRSAGLDVDVYRPRPGQHLSYHEFEGVEVTTGSWESLDRTIRDGSYRTIAVHFMNPSLWSVLREHLASHRIIVWVHGQDIQPWWRREFDAGEVDLDAVKAQSDRKMQFWSELAETATMSSNLHFVFVSQGFAAEVMEDYPERFDPKTVHVIHNPVDTDLFAYAPKSADQRRKILSVRSFASPKYANDVSVAAVLRLAQEPWFGELEFCFVGDGALFEQTLEPLRGFDNVTIHQGFLNHAALVDLQRGYGVFLTPSRWDSQGVSRDEAMSSGLVPITSDAGAISEFVSPDEGFVLPIEDIDGTAAAITRLYHDPQLFQRLSQASAQRIRRQSTLEIVLALELELFRTSADWQSPDADMANDPTKPPTGQGRSRVTSHQG